MTILQKIDRFLHASGMPPTLFGRNAVHDPRLVGDLRNGREPRPDTVARIETYIAEQEGRA
ncbi:MULTISPECIES: hypothetical protein [Sphingomonas]|uniref:XRE family transcriptional regulator n=2 Tax=Sphingomonas TaxID=13687 RepID=A0A4Q2IU56_9SPHN|nr:MULTISPECIES: hypothetical protein [Sphingomonas]GLK22355.1 hypothetical protein GCM10017606_31830 [Microbacterium terregens]MBB3911048.1 hypothetical protein [Sphingomonas desiccabilis]MBM7406088.1 hypothetical protein [Sphingomonas sp. JUb134]MCG7349066.1 hypothetical protein [Sphingomonas sp. ACRSK]RSV15415.1 hypothetical protein CA235_08545 [Sphingomonas sp. ABOLF]